MKKLNQFMNLFSIRDIYQAYRECIKNKKGTKDYLEYINNYGEEDLYNLLEEINSRTYKKGRGKCFVVMHPKPREVFAAAFRDRIVHHLIIREIEPYFEKRFQSGVYSCRKGKGTLKAVKDLYSHIKSLPGDYYYLQMDIKGFFMSIEKNILFELINKHIRKKNFARYQLLRYLIREIIFEDITDNVSKVGDQKLFAEVPHYKSLFKTPRNRGLPIGDLTSQFFANVYLNEMDQFIKRNLRIKHYFRYVDDFILLGSKEDLLESRKFIEDFLEKRLSIQIAKNKTRLYPLHYDIDFLGYVIKRKSYMLPRKRNKKALIKTVKGFSYKSNYSLLKNQASINSYCGLFRHCNSFSFRKSLLQKFDNLFVYNDKAFQKVFVDNNIYRYLEDENQKTMNNYRYFQKQYRNHIILMQIGCFYKCFDFNAIYFAEQMGLNLTLFNPGTRGEAVMCGFHKDCLLKYIGFIKEKKINTVIISQKKTEGGEIGRYVENIYTYDKSWQVPSCGKQKIDEIKRNYHEKYNSSQKNRQKKDTGNSINELERKFLQEFYHLDLYNLTGYDLIKFVFDWKKEFNQYK